MRSSKDGEKLGGPASLGRHFDQLAWRELFNHRREWDLLKPAPALGKRPVLLITTNDGTGPASEGLLQAAK